MLTKLTIENFKAHAHTELTLEPFTVLVGANGVGKTSVLEALHIVGQSLKKPLGLLMRGPWKPERVLRGAEQVGTLGVQSVSDDRQARSVVVRFTSDLSGSSGVELPELKQRVRANDAFGEVPPTVRPISRLVLLRPSARAIAATGYHEPSGLRVEHDGSNTAAVLGSWKLDDAEAWRLKGVLAGLQRVVPQVQNLRVRSAPARTETAEGAVGANGFDLVVDFDDAKGVAATSVSEGTLVALAVLTLLHTNPQPQLLLLDDLGAELHPTGQGELVRALLAIQADNPKLQIVASTHSPYILDALEPKNVRVFARGKDGAARVRSLAEHPQAGHEGITTGQLWTMDPETWVLEGQP